MSVSEQKQQLRSAVRAKIRKLSPEIRAKNSERICCQLLSLPEYQSAHTLLAFSGTAHEIDTAFFLQTALLQGKRLCLPRCIENGGLALCQITSFDDLQRGAYGILEPNSNCPILCAQQIEFAVIPCLSFDSSGNRLGQGGGYYDRLLPQLACPTVLVCQQELLLPCIPAEKHDVRCTLYLTEQGLCSLPF